MTCPKCSAPLARMSYEVSSTLVGFYTHGCSGRHDDNCVKRYAWCVNGHRTLISLRRTCSDNEPQVSWATEPRGERLCDWQGQDRCSCHEGTKLDAWPDLPVV